MTESRLGDTFALIDVLDRSHAVLSLYVRLKKHKHMTLVERSMHETADEARARSLRNLPNVEPMIVRNRFE